MYQAKFYTYRRWAAFAGVVSIFAIIFSPSIYATVSAGVAAMACVLTAQCASMALKQQRFDAFNSHRTLTMMLLALETPERVIKACRVLTGQPVSMPHAIQLLKEANADRLAKLCELPPIHHPGVIVKDVQGTQGSES